MRKPVFVSHVINTNIETTAFTIYTANNKGGDQSARIRMLIRTLIVHIYGILWHKVRLSWSN